MPKKFEDNIKYIGTMLIERHLGNCWKFVWCYSSLPKEEKCSLLIGKETLGICNSKEKKIGLNLKLTRENELFTFWLDVILHEIAHAKTTYFPLVKSHGLLWKRQARKIGAHPNPESSPDWYIENKRGWGVKQ